MKCLSVDPPAPVLQVFNYTLRFGQVVLINEVPLRRPACAGVAGYRFGVNEHLFTDNRLLIIIPCGSMKWVVLKRALVPIHPSAMFGTTILGSGA